MQKSILLVLLVCSIGASEAQSKCDSLFGKWVFTRWETDHLFLDIEDSVTTIQNKFQKYKEAHNGTTLSKADNLELVNGLSEVLEGIRTNGFITFTFNKDKTFSWIGTLNDPNERFSGTYSCNGNTVMFLNKQEKAEGTEQISLQLISFTKNRITVAFPSSNDPNFKNSRMSFKKVP